MELVAPAGAVYQAGTFSGNPLSLAAGAATLSHLHSHVDIYRTLEEYTRTIGESAKGEGSFVRIGSLFQYFFRGNPPRNYREAKECDTEAFGRFWKGMLDAGIFLPPSQFETCFVSTAHTHEDIENIGAAYQSCLSG